MSRHRPPHIAQGTWRSGALHVWGWNGIDTASMAWLYSGFRKMAADGTITGWHDAPISYGPVARVTISLPGRPTLHASSVQLDPFGCAVWLSDLPSKEHLSDSLAWFAQLAELARRAVSSGHITPVVVEEGPFTVGRWAPVPTPAVTSALEALAAAMPPICVAGSSATTEQIFERMVDGLARSFLARVGWRPDLGRQRKPAAQALRAVFGALSKPDHVIRSGSDDFDLALRALRDELDRHRRRLGGEPVVVLRVRLLISDDPLDAWQARLELVDDRDSMRWCTANDVWERNDAAVEVARQPAHLDSLAALISDVVDRIAPVVPGLAELAAQHEPTGVELDLDTAEDFLDLAPIELQRAGVELIGPERLVRSRLAVSGDATPR